LPAEGHPTRNAPSRCGHTRKTVFVSVIAAVIILLNAYLIYSTIPG